MAKEWSKKLSNIVTWASNICGITGKPILVLLGGIGTVITAVITGVLQHFLKDFKVTIIVLSIVVVIVLIVYIVIQTKKYHRELDELNKRISACKKAIMTINRRKLTEFTPVDYYMIDKDVYDGFKTRLKITECILEVRFLENTEDRKEYDYEFKWILTVKNPSAEPQSMAKFIYSGEKEGEEAPHLHVESSDIVIEDHKRKGNIKVLREDDRFEEISFADGLKRGKEVTITIEYVFKKYKFDPKEIPIWLVPDALGFAGMDKYCIRFHSDGKIVHEETDVVLYSYILNEEYNREHSDEKTIDFDRNKNWFEAKSGRREKLHGKGYQLILTNR